MFCVYGCHSGMKDDIAYLLYNDNYAYQWIFQELYKETDSMYDVVKELLFKYGVCVDSGELYLDRESVRLLYRELRDISRNDYLVEAIEYRKKVVFNDNYYFFFIVDFY
ncbi:MAG: hypothetical protein E6617_08540 [Staphylococcus lugdunensis]|nr:hypothetical protein [Staphylococcus lugdunensis]